MQDYFRSQAKGAELMYAEYVPVETTSREYILAETTFNEDHVKTKPTLPSSPLTTATPAYNSPNFARYSFDNFPKSTDNSLNCYQIFFCF